MGTVRYTVFDGEIVSENRNGTIRDYVPDSLGSTRALLDENQNVTDSWTYWPYGEVQSHTGATDTPFTFVGTLGYYSGGSGGTYVRSRWYLTERSIWTTLDSLWPEEMAYVYAAGSPVTKNDHSGKQSTEGPSKIVIPGATIILSYGSYCGGDRNPLIECKKYGQPPPIPTDNVDACCVDHDNSYNKYKCDWKENVSWNCRKADVNLCVCLARNKCKYKTKIEQDACNAFRNGAILWFCQIKQRR